LNPNKANKTKSAEKRQKTAELAGNPAPVITTQKANKKAAAAPALISRKSGAAATATQNG